MLTTRQAAVHLGRSQQNVFRLVQQGKLEAQVGTTGPFKRRCYLISEDEVERHLREGRRHKHTSGAPPATFEPLLAALDNLRAARTQRDDEIRRLVAGGCSINAIADETGLHRSTITRIAPGLRPETALRHPLTSLRTLRRLIGRRDRAEAAILIELKRLDENPDVTAAPLAEALGVNRATAGRALLASRADRVTLAAASS